jgi:hypothetical protein
MDKFIIMNVHDTMPKKTRQIIFTFFPIFFSLVYEKKIHVKKMINFLNYYYYENYQYFMIFIFY